MTGTFAGQLFGYSGGHIFSTDLMLTLVGAGKEVKGAWTSEQGKSGNVTGTLAGSNIREPAIGATRALRRHLRWFSGDSRRRTTFGSYTSTDCKGQVDVSFIVVKH